MRPAEVAKVYEFAKKTTDLKLGFHSHDNLSLAAANCLAAGDSGCQIVDTTFTGMGRGAGNMRTEDMLLLMKSPHALANEVCEFVDELTKKKQKLGWGANFAYAAAASNHLPQARVMELLSLKRFTLGEILSETKLIDNNTHNHSQTGQNKIQIHNPLLIGGGFSFDFHLEWSLEDLLRSRDLIFISPRAFSNFISACRDVTVTSNIYMLAPEAKLNQLQKKILNDEF